jgi:hypothetical protein
VRDFFAVDFFAVDFLALDFLAVVFFVAAFVAGVFSAVAPSLAGSFAGVVVFAAASSREVDGVVGAVV